VKQHILEHLVTLLVEQSKLANHTLIFEDNMSEDKKDVSFWTAQDADLEPLQDAEVTKDEVEDEVLEAVEEAKAEIEVSAIQEIKLEEKTPISKNMLQRMRLRDRSFNKTCATCGRRAPLAEIGNGNSEICDSCKD
jgi:rRNA maturation endonuclease Nob1